MPTLKELNRLKAREDGPPEKFVWRRRMLNSEVVARIRHE
jgi:hypothetical protein